MFSRKKFRKSGFSSLSKLVYKATHVALLSSGLSILAQAPLHLETQRNLPRLSWANTNGVEFQLLRSGPDLSSNWQTMIKLTGDAKELRWVDESANGNPTRCFYQWRIENPGAHTHKLQAALDRARGSAGVPGAAAAVLSSEGLWIGTSGVSDQKARTQIEPQMRFGIGSLSKSFAAATILQLEEEGVLSVNDSLKRWLPDFPHVTNTITLRQLLNHTSGVYDITDSWDWYYDTIAHPEQRFTVESLWKYIQEPYFAPGTAFHYSNTGYILLGLVIESATGHQVTDEYRRRFIEPLHLSSVYMEAAESPSGDVVYFYSDFNPSGKVEDIFSIPRTAYCSQYWTAGALFADVQDIAIWAGALWSGKILSAKSLQEMLIWDRVTGSEQYGFAVWSIATARGQFFVHSGHLPGFRSYAGYSPTLKTTVVLFFNNESEIEPAWRSLVSAL